MDMSQIEWRKASYSTTNGGSCVEVGMTPVAWRKASYSNVNGGNCVEVETAERVVAVRDSKDPDGPKLVFGRTEWTAFAAQVKAGQFNA
jgi:hypothetical protein